MDYCIGSEKFGLGPMAVLLKQDGPFVTYTTATKTTFGLNTESTYDWEAEQWTVPINLTVSHLFRLGSQPISLTLGGRYYAERPAGGPDWGIRLVLTFLFPKK